jgi:hypothetical protein
MTEPEPGRGCRAAGRRGGSELHRAAARQMSGRAEERETRGKGWRTGGEEEKRWAEGWGMRSKGEARQGKPISGCLPGPHDAAPAEAQACARLTTTAKLDRVIVARLPCDVHHHPTFFVRFACSLSIAWPLVRPPIMVAAAVVHTPGLPDFIKSLKTQPAESSIEHLILYENSPPAAPPAGRR